MKRARRVVAALWLSPALAGLVVLHAPADGLTDDVDHSFENWLAYRGDRHAGRGQLDPHSQFKVAEALEARFEGHPEFATWQRVKRLDLAARAFQAAVRQSVGLTEDQLRTAFRDRPEEFTAKQRWRLENIFKAYPPDPSPEQKRALHDQMARIRSRIVGGEEFAVIALELSDSQTRLRGGRMGTVTLEELAPAVREHVRTLRVDELSPVIATEDGLHLIRCSQVLEARETFEDVRSLIEKTLRREAVATSLSAARAASHEALAPSCSVREIDWTSGDDRPVLSFAASAEVDPFHRDQFIAWLKYRGVPTAPWEMSGSDLDQLCSQLARTVGDAKAAERRDLDQTSAYLTAVAWEEWQLRAELVLSREVESRFDPPTEAEVESYFDRHRSHWVTAERLKLSVLRLPIDRSLSRQVYETADRLGRELQGGTIDLDAALAALEHADLTDLGWLTRDQIWRLGANIDAATRDLAVGGWSALVQEGRELFLIRVVDREPETQLDLADVEGSIRLSLTRARKEALRAQVQSEILASVNETAKAEQ